MKKFNFIIILFVLTNYSLYSQNISKKVIGNGGTTMSDGNNKISCTIGQTATGRLSFQSGDHGVGFWYSSKKILDINASGLMIVLPKMEAQIGTQISVPLMIEYSNNLSNSGVRNFEAKINYNGTVLFPINLIPKCKVDNDECSIIISGTMKDTLGILANLDFIVKLGNSDSTLLQIEYFKWIEPNKVALMTRDGQIDVLGICREGESPRLLKRGNPTALLSIYPNPARDNTSINYTLNESGHTEIYLIDEMGKTALSLLSKNSIPGSYSLKAKLEDIRNGSYFLILKTPSEMFTKKILINK